MDQMILPQELRAKFTPQEITALQNAARQDYSGDCHFFTDPQEKLAEMRNAGVLTKEEVSALRAWIANPNYCAQSPHGALAGAFDLHPPIAIVTGWVAYVAACEMEVKPWADWKERGFLSPMEARQTLGCLLTEYPMDHHRGYRWTGPTGEYVISGDTNADLRIFRRPAGIGLCHYGEIISRVQPKALEESIYGYHSTEGQLLAAIIAGSWQTGFPLACLTDWPAFEVHALQVIRGLRCDPPIFTSSSRGDLDASMHAGTATWPLPDLGDKRCVHTLAREFGEPYTLHLDGTDLMACSREAISLRLPQDEWDQAVLGLFIQAARHGGRTPVSVLAEIVRICLAPASRAEFDTNVKFVRDTKARVAHPA